jgi:hypothetical protein
MIDCDVVFAAPGETRMGQLSLSYGGMSATPPVRRSPCRPAVRHGMTPARRVDPPKRARHESAVAPPPAAKTERPSRRGGRDEACPQTEGASALVYARANACPTSWARRMGQSRI